MCNDLIKEYEGCKLQAYKCPAGVWTIGYGITFYPNGCPVKEGDIITEEYAEALLTDYIIKNIYPIFQKIPYVITRSQRDALTSLIYNIGGPAFLKSKLYKAICKKDFANIFKEWDFGYNQFKGLAKRRAHELHLFLKDI